jgi:hypothetical protein
MVAEEFDIPEVRAQVGWRLSDQDRKDLRILLADRREKVIANVLRDVIHREAEATRRRWEKAASRIADLEEANG